jgi:hypothetical protein
MLPTRFDFHKVLINPDIFRRKDIYKYLVLATWHTKEFEGVLKRPADAGFTAFVEKHVENYLQGTAPPEAIQSAVLNLADDVAAGREVTVRAGDYIALQTHYLAQKGGAAKRTR